METETEITPLYQLTPDISTVARDAPSQSQEFGTQFRSPVYIVVTSSITFAFRGAHLAGTWKWEQPTLEPRYYDI